MKNRLLLIFVSLFQKLLPKREGRKNILIVSTTALGDTLWATPAIKSLKKSLPTSSITVLTSFIGMEVLKENPDIDELIFLKEPLLTSFFPLWKKLFSKRFSAVLIFHASQRLTLPLVSLLGASKIVGTKGINKGLDALLTDPIEPKYEHEIQRRLAIIEKIGAKEKTKKLYFYLKDKPQPKEGFRIALHPGSKDPFKRWPKESFIALAKALQKKIDCELFLTGTPNEKPLLEEIAKEANGVQIANTQQSLKEFGSWLENIDLLIANDTGPVHLSIAINTPVVAIYAATDPNLCGPYHVASAKAIYRNIACHPCLKRKCQTPFCFLQIGVDEVLQEALSLIEKKSFKYLPDNLILPGD